MSERTKRRLTIRGVLSALIILVLVRSVIMGNYENAFVCILSLVLFCVPIFLEKQLAIDIPPVMEGIIYCFIFAAEILGEINSFYTLIPGWDTMLHTLNGFLVAAVGFCLVDLFNRSERMTFRLSPLFFHDCWGFMGIFRIFHGSALTYGYAERLFGAEYQFRIAESIWVECCCA